MSTTTNYKEITVDEQCNPLQDIQLADGAAAWKSMAQVILAEQNSVHEWAAQLRQRINEDALAVFKEVALPLMRIAHSERQLDIAEQRTNAASLVEETLAAAFDETVLRSLVPQPESVESTNKTGSESHE